MFCTQCGAKNEGNEKFCTHCGTRYESSDKKQTRQPSQGTNAQSENNTEFVNGTTTSTTSYGSRGGGGVSFGGHTFSSGSYRGHSAGNRGGHHEQGHPPHRPSSYKHLFEPTQNSYESDHRYDRHTGRRGVARFKGLIVLGIFIFMCVVTMGGTFCSVIMDDFFSEDNYGSSYEDTYDKNDTITKESYYMITTGMTEAEVMNILGSGRKFQNADNSGEMILYYKWSSSYTNVSITIGFTNGYVVNKSMQY